MKIILLIPVMLLHFIGNYSALAKTIANSAVANKAAKNKENITGKVLSTTNSASDDHDDTNLTSAKEKPLISEINIADIKQNCNAIASAPTTIFDDINIISNTGTQHDSKTLPKTHATAPNTDTDIVLNSILYISQKQWYVWLSGKKYDHTNIQSSEFIISEVKSDYVTIKISATAMDAHMVQKNKQDMIIHHEQAELTKTQGKDIIVLKLGIGQFFQRKTAKVLDFYH